MTPIIIKRILKGSGAQGIGFVARIAEQLLMIPILLSAWSVQLYGEWLLISAVPVYLSLSDMGFVTSGSNELTKRAQSGITPNVRRFYQDYVSVFAQWSFLIFVVVALITMAMPFEQVFNLTVMSASTAQLAFISLIAGALLSQNALTLIAGLRAKHAFHVGVFIRALTSISSLLLVSCMVFFFDAGPLSMAIGMVALRILEFFGLGLILKAKDFSPGWRFLRKPNEPMLPLLKTGLEYMLMPASQAIVIQGMVILIGASLGAAAVALYATHRTLARMTAQVVQLGVAPLRAELGLLHGEENKTIVKQLMVRGASLTLWASILAAVSLMVIGKPVFEAWTNDSLEFDRRLFAFLLAATVFEGLWRVAATLRLGTNQHRPLARGYFVLSCSGMIIAYLFVSILGILGSGLSLWLIDISMLVLVVILNQKLINQSAGAYLREVMRPPVGDFLKLLRLVAKRFRK
jgi:O-antigen/teichoic acid export membrane protein